MLEFMKKHCKESDFLNLPEIEIINTKVDSTNIELKKQTVELKTFGRPYNNELEEQIEQLSAKLSQCNDALRHEISKRKWTEKSLQDAKVFSEIMAETIRESILVLNSNMEVNTVNQSFYKTFHLLPEETENHVYSR